MHRPPIGQDRRRTRAVSPRPVSLRFFHDRTGRHWHTTQTGCPGALIGETRHIADQDQALNGSIQDLKLSVDHISNQQAFVGAQINKVERQVEVLANRKIAVSERVSELGDADLAELVTKLQGLLVSRDAAQQAFAKIGQQSLFDFIR